MGIENSYLSVFAPLATAVIAGVVALIVTILAKEQKTSEFRQSWIDSLRSDVSELAGVLETVTDLVESKIKGGEVDGEKIIYDKKEEAIRVQTCIVRIRLRLNPSEHDHILQPLKRLADSEVEQLSEDVLSDLEFVVSGVQAVLKGEWERVKLGEPAYRKLKKVASRVVRSGIVAAFIVVAVYFVQRIMFYVSEIKLYLFKFL